MESIEVLWELHGKLVWWEAEVIRITQADPAQCTAEATIRYKPKNKYHAEDYEVSFQPLSLGFKQLHHTNPEVQGLTPWKYSDERVDKKRL